MAGKAAQRIKARARRKCCARQAGALIFGLSFALLPFPALQAQTPGEQIETERRAREGTLDELNARLSLSADALKRLEDDVDQIKRDRQELSRQAVLSAKAVQQAEADISASEDRLRGLAREEAKAREALAAKRDVIIELLAALQRMSRNPPPAIIVAPENALQTVRSAILLGAVLPELREEAEKVLGELEKLRGVRAAIAGELSTRQRQLLTLTETRARLDLLTEEKKRQLATSEQEIRLSRQKMDELVGQARSLKDLLARLDAAVDTAKREDQRKQEEEQRRQGRELAAREKAYDDAAPGKSEDAGLPAEKQVAVLPAGRLPPASLPFEQAKGKIALPASGQILRRYGEEDGAGGSSRGVYLSTRVEAVVSAPAEGWVVYAGAFRSYGQIVIINVGAGHHILLAGMEQITVEPGQFVLAGESIARMGQTVLAKAATPDLDSARPVLYIEFRKDGATIDPASWWVANSEKARG